MKKEVRPLIYTLIVLVVLIAAYPTYRLGSKVMTEIKIERLLAETGYDQDISKKETVYDSKTVYNQHNVGVTAPGQHELK